jgi:hypothetical protein
MWAQAEASIFDATGFEAHVVKSAFEYVVAASQASHGVAEMAAEHESGGSRLFGVAWSYDDQLK